MLFTLVQILILIKQPLLGWDEAVYVGMAKYIVSSGTAGLWEDLRPLGLPLILSSIWKLPLEIATLILLSKILMIAIATALIYAVYAISTKLFNKKTGFMAAILTAVTPVFLFSSHLIHTEMLSTILGLAAVYFFIDKKYYLTGIFTALSFLTKFPQGILLAAFVITLLFSKQYKNILKVMCSFLVLTMPFLIFNFAVYGDIFHTITAATPHQNNPTFSVIDGTVSSYLHNTLYYPLELLKQNIFFIFIIPALLQIKDNKKNPLFWIIILFVAYFTIALNKQIRFALLFSPYISILAAQGINTAKKKHLAFCSIIFLLTFFSFSEYSAIKTVDEQIMDFYGFFDTLQGPVLTANPIPAAYSNKLFMPFYQDVETAHEIYDTNENISTIAYTTEFYPCSNYNRGQKYTVESCPLLINEGHFMRQNYPEGIINYLCPSLYADRELCEERKKELIKKISRGRKKVYSIEYGQEYIIYSNQKLP